MSARQEHVTLLAEQDSSDSGGGSKAGAIGGGVEHDGEKDKVSPHQGDEGSLRRWEELLRSAHVNGGRWRPGVIDGGVTNGECDGWGAQQRAVLARVANIKPLVLVFYFWCILLALDRV